MIVPNAESQNSAESFVCGMCTFWHNLVYNPDGQIGIHLDINSEPWCPQAVHSRSSALRGRMPFKLKSFVFPTVYGKIDYAFS